MLKAITEKGKYVTLAILPKRQIELLRKRVKFYCPECNEQVIVRAGPKVIPHFAHKNSSNCSIRSGGEGTYHQYGKLLLYEWFQKQNIPTQLEAFIPQINQRPDLLIKTKQLTFAVEFQCATISAKDIQHRNTGYERLNILPIWILGGNQFNRISTNHMALNDFTLQFIHQFSSKLPTTIFYFCPQRKNFSIIHDLILTSTNRALVNFTFKKMNETSFPKLFTPSYFSEKRLFSLWRPEKRKFRLKNTNVYGREYIWKKWLYEKRLHVQHLPSIVHLPIRSQYSMSVPTWNWQSRFIIDFLHSLKVGDSFSLKQAAQYLRPFQSDNTNNRFIVPKVSPIVEYLTYLHDLKIIQIMSSNLYKKCKPITFYNHIEQSLEGDDELLNSFMYNHN
ncbi:competence protein CoiA family protein [Pseudogracilibacillus sp. SE30717A]|uniref:competence protein CoiA n=1 Tax=Pseudogracilibacillus sp. SE30717A TaxID=3098293 RepID=UPI00300E0DB5